MKKILILVIALALASLGYGQSASAPSQVATTPGQSATAPGQAKKDDGTAGPDLTTSRTTVDNAKNLAKGNDATGAEQALTTLNLAKPNTAEWHMETAQRLMLTAEQLAREGQPASATALVNSALSHLTQADPLAKDAPTRAAAKTFAGFIQERYLANHTAALASYQAAVQLSPATATAAKEASDRLQKSDDDLKNKIAKGGK